MATLKRVLKHDCIVLLKQYRPPLQAYSIEFVAGQSSLYITWEKLSKILLM